MPLLDLNCSKTKVIDLSPLKGMKLTTLNCDGTLIADLSPLKGMPLAFLSCGYTSVSDLSPLRGLPLKHLEGAIPQRDADILRSLPTLETINGKPAKEVLGEAGEKKP